MKAVNMQKRIFIGIKVSDEIAEACVKLQADLADFPVRFIPPEDIHLTLIPPMEMTDLSFIEERLRQAFRNAKRFKLVLNSLSLVPNKMTPKLIWVECEESSEILELKRKLSEAFGIHERVPFRPHVTIARIPEENIDKLPRRSIARKIGLYMLVESVQIFESPHRGGGGCKVISSVRIPYDGLTPH